MIFGQTQIDPVGQDAFANVGAALQQGNEAGSKALDPMLKAMANRKANLAANKMDPSLQQFRNAPAPTLQTPQLGQSVAPQPRGFAPQPQFGGASLMKQDELAKAMGYY